MWHILNTVKVFNIKISTKYQNYSFNLKSHNFFPALFFDFDFCNWYCVFKFVVFIAFNPFRLQESYKSDYVSQNTNITEKNIKLSIQVSLAGLSFAFDTIPLLLLMKCILILSIKKLKLRIYFQML
jgi:hypothetical protein